MAPRYGGPSVAVLEMMRALRARGHQATLATTDADGAGRLAVSAGVVQEYRGVPVWFFRRSFSESFKYSPGLAEWLRLHTCDFDVVHIHAVMSHASVAATRAARAAGVPYVLRTIGTLDPWSIGQKALKKRLFMAAAGRAMLRHAAAVHATSPDEAAVLAQTWRVPRVATIPLGVDDDAFAAPDPAPASPPFVVTLSRVHPVKGLDLLVDAFAAATRDPARAHWRLKIAGDGADADVASLLRQVRASPAADRIELVGWLDGADKTALLGAASIFALTSRHENFGIAIAEAMARRLPVLTTRGVQLASWIESAGAGWVAELDRAAIEAALGAAMGDFAERQRRAAAGRRLALRWRWPAIADQLTELYEQVVGQVAQPIRPAALWEPPARPRLDARIVRPGEDR